VENKAIKVVDKVEWVQATWQVALAAAWAAAVWEPVWVVAVKVAAWAALVWAAATAAYNLKIYFLSDLSRLSTVGGITHTINRRR
jgi:hypothetical protein